MSNLMKYHISKRNTAAVKLLIYLVAAVGTTFLTTVLRGSDTHIALLLLTGGALGLSYMCAAINLVELIVNAFHIRTLKQPIRKKTSRISNGIAFAEEADIKLLEDMAEEGYALTHITKYGFYKFEPAEPMECNFSIDYTDITENGEEMEQYLAIFAAGGWQLVCGIGSNFWFRAPRGTTPIYTDKSDMIQKYTNMRNTCTKAVIFHGSIAILSAVALYFSPSDVISTVALIILGGAGGMSFAFTWALVKHHKLVMRLKNR